MWGLPPLSELVGRMLAASLLYCADSSCLAVWLLHHNLQGRHHRQPPGRAARHHGLALTLQSTCGSDSSVLMLPQQLCVHAPPPAAWAPAQLEVVRPVSAAEAALEPAHPV